MGEENQQLSKESIEFSKKLFRIYLEERNFQVFLSMLHEDITWFGTGGHEVCHNYEEAVALAKAEKDSWDGHFKILEQWYRAIPLDDVFCIVIGELKIVEDGLNTFLLDMDSRFSFICKKEKTEIKLYHVHFSVPNAAQASDEFVHKSLIRDYNILLEEKLQERTKQLQEKSFELETLTNNIEAAIICSSFDEWFTITFASDGLFRMIGYTREQFEQEKGNSIAELTYEEDCGMLNAKVKEQLNDDNRISDVQRLIRRDGSCIWVLVKGCVTSEMDGGRIFQGVMTDITEQQEQKEELRISEKRYEIAIRQSDVTMFEYDLVKKQLILPGPAADMYSIPMIIDNGVENFIKKGIIEPESADVYREMYRQIHAGVPFAKCLVNSKDAKGTIHEFELSLTNVYDNNKRPIRAIGVRKNVTQIRQLQKEKEFGATLASGKYFICEANVTQNRILKLDKKWAEYTSTDASQTYSELVSVACRNVIDTHFISLIKRQLSSESIIEAFNNKKRLISFSYRKKSTEGIYRWFEATVNIIRDKVTKDIIIRYYTEDINSRKEKEQKALEEKRLYETRIAKSVMAYEVNFTKNIMISGQENWKELFGIDVSDNYTELINSLCDQVLHKEDGKNFFKLYKRENVLLAFEEGERELACDYQRPDENGNYIWVRCALHLYEDPETEDISGYFYIENIDKQKQAELVLVYKSEHDMLTGLYNKATAEKLVSDFLKFNDDKKGMHAFIIIDVDNFKLVNDNFGHAFGDAVLSQVAGKIAELFREDDIVGRIGGDEFAVLMKNIPSGKLAESKARELCKNAAEEYLQNGKNYKLSVSVGIAIYDMHGKTYNELYRHSDSALYVSKRNGRNCYTVYHEDMKNAVSNIKEIESDKIVELMPFNKSISEYIFRILYESKDRRASINAVMSLIGRHFNVSRVYIFEDSEDRSHTSVTFEWCNTGIEPQKQHLQNIKYNIQHKYEENFDSGGVLSIPDMKKADPSATEIGVADGIKSRLQISIIRNNSFAGFVGFDQCSFQWVPSKKEISDCRNVARILGVFITEMQLLKKAERQAVIDLV